MKHMKKIGLFVMAAASLMAFAGSAYAYTFTSPTKTAYTGPFSMSLEGTSLLKGGFAEITCSSSKIAGTLSTNNEEHATGPTTSVSFGSASTPCTSNLGAATVTTLNSKGTITIKKGTSAVSGTGVEVTTAAGGTSCVYGMGAAGTLLGTASNTTVGGVDQVTLAISADLVKISGGFLCASPAEWTANYIVLTPSSSFVE
jgi:hypothetical protein